MKNIFKKWLVIVLAVVAVAFAFTACGISSGEKGKYHMYYNGECTSSCYIELDGNGGCTYFVGKDLANADEDKTVTGVYTIDGTRIAITMTYNGESQSFEGMLKNGVLDLEDFAVFYKNGKMPDKTDDSDSYDELDSVDGIYYYWKDGKLLTNARVLMLQDGKGFWGWLGTCIVSGENIEFNVTFSDSTEKFIFTATINNGKLVCYSENEYIGYFSKENPTSKGGNSGNEQNLDGTYYYYSDGTDALGSDGEMQLLIKNDKFCFSCNPLTYTVSGDNISISIYNDEREGYYTETGTVNNGVIFISYVDYSSWGGGEDDVEWYYCKEGATPSTNNNDGNDSVSSSVDGTITIVQTANLLTN